MPEFVATPVQSEFMTSDKYMRVIGGPVGCLRGDALVVTEFGPMPISQIRGPVRVLSWNDRAGRFQLSWCGGAFPKGKDYLVRVSTPRGEFVAAEHHLLFSAERGYRRVSDQDLSSVSVCSADPLAILDGVYQPESLADAPRSIRTAVDSLVHYAESARRYGQQLLQGEEDVLACAPLQGGVRELAGGAPAYPVFVHALRSLAALVRERIHQGLSCARLGIGGLASQRLRPPFAEVGCISGHAFLSASQSTRLAELSERSCASRRTSSPQGHTRWGQILSGVLGARRTAARRCGRSDSSHHSAAYVSSLANEPIMSRERRPVQEVYWDLQVLDTNNYVTVDGTIHHNSGKSVACTNELVRLAMMQEPNEDGVRKTRMLVIRNTADQLRSTTMKTVFDWYPPGQYGRWKATEKTFFFEVPLPDGTFAYSEWFFVPLDTPDDVRKLLSLEATFAWLNECREIRPEIVDALATRVGRYPSAKDGGCTRKGIIADTNMPDSDSWWGERMKSPPDNWSVHIQPPAVIPLDYYIERFKEDPPEDLMFRDRDGDWWAVNPEADNLKHLPYDYYVNAGTGKDKEFINVYLACEYGMSISGRPVYEKTFRRLRHVANEPLSPIKSKAYPVIVGIDVGRTPAAAFTQLTPSGTLNVISELTSENMGIKTFIETLLLPHIAEYYQGCELVFAPDPAAWQKSQVNEDSPVDVMRRYGFRIVKPKTNKPLMRIEAVEQFLTQDIDGKSGFQIDPTKCPVLMEGFRGRYRWKETRQGDIMTSGQTPQIVKDFVSHVHDALQYACVVQKQNIGMSVSERMSADAIPYVAFEPFDAEVGY